MALRRNSILAGILAAHPIDVVRVSYSDLIGVDRGRDVLIDELPTTMGHGIAFCRAVYHTSPMGDVVPVQGGIESWFPYVLAILFLLVRPEGLFGEKIIRRV